MPFFIVSSMEDRVTWEDVVNLFDGVDDKETKWRSG